MGDVDEDYIHIRRAIVNRKLDEPKTAESIACLPLLDQVRVPLELWRGKRTNTAPDEWVIVDVPNMLNRVIKPHVIAKRFPHHQALSGRASMPVAEVLARLLLRLPMATLLLKLCCVTRR